MIFDHPATHLITNTATITTIVFAGGFACGYGAAWVLGIQPPEYAGLGVGGWCAVLAATLFPVVAKAAEREYWIYRQMNREAATPAPEPTGHRLTLEVDATSTEIFDLPVNVEELAALTHGLAQNKSLSGRRWYGAGKPFAQNTFMRIRREMVRRGLAEAMGNSYVLTDKGVQAFARGQVSPTFAIDKPLENYPLNKRFRQLNRGRRGEGQGARR